MKATLRYYILLILSMALAACADDFEVQPDTPPSEETAMVDLEASFYPHHIASLETRSQGDALNEMENLFVGFYSTETSTDPDQNKKLLFAYYFDAATSTPLVVNDKPDREEGYDSTEPTDKDLICKGTVSRVEIPIGKYHVVAVANMGNLEVTKPDEIGTLAKISAISLTWQDDLSKNNQMAGYFSLERLANAPHTGAAPLEVEVTGKTKTLHAWLRRAASKVTVSFDATQMNQNIYVYIKSIKLKDIPKTCPLINKNTPTTPFTYTSSGSEPNVTYSITNRSASDLIEDGEGVIIDSNPGNDDFKNWPCLSRGKNGYLDTYMGGKDPHAPDSPVSLFFYENMQGVSTGERTKEQVQPEVSDIYNPTYPDGRKPTNQHWKDEKKCGTYVEVEGYYESFAGGNHTKGAIIYRFMLGKDVKQDFNAERNYHYKLTLVFKGNANDVDWHIDYKEDTQYWAPSPYYISYQYNKVMYLPIQTQGDVARIEAQILENDWFPSGETSTEQEDLISHNGTGSPYKIYWGGTMATSVCTHRSSLAAGEHYGCHLGFLALKDEQVRTIEETGNEFNQDADVTRTYPGVHYLDDLWHTNNLGYREYFNPFIPSQRSNFLSTSKPDRYYGVYNVETETINQNTHHVFQIPLYTRALNLVTVTGYTGNNPFFNYIRKALVRIKAYTTEDALVTGYNPKTGQNEDHIDIEIIQVRRIINPKGIFRHAKNAGPFHVVLMERHGDINHAKEETRYEAAVSHGTWTARIIAGEEWVRIGKTSDSYGSQAIYGDTETNIDFWFKPAGTIGETETRAGLIEVTYNNNTCVHTIVVKQGYAPVQVIVDRPGTGTPYAKWTNFNMRSATEMCKSPLEEGSYFRAARQTDPIDPSNFWGWDVKDQSQTFTLYPASEGITKTWANIGKMTFPSSTNLTASTSDELFKSWEITDSYGNNLTVAELQDFAYMRNQRHDWSVAPDIDIAYGIVYADGATACQTQLELAHGYKYNDENITYDQTYGYPKSIRGMRGCLAYNNGYYSNAHKGNSVFFPAGVTGYGFIRHRSGNNGMMAYGAPVDCLTNEGTDKAEGKTYKDVRMSYRPILHRIDQNFGMVYWHRKYEREFKKEATTSYAYGSAWDFNMSTFDFNFFGDNGNNCANLVRMVVPATNTSYKPSNEKLFPTYNN